MTVSRSIALGEDGFVLRVEVFDLESEDPLNLDGSTLADGAVFRFVKPGGAIVERLASRVVAGAAEWDVENGFFANADDVGVWQLQLHIEGAASSWKLTSPKSYFELRLV